MKLVFIFIMSMWFNLIFAQKLSIPKQYHYTDFQIDSLKNLIQSSSNQFTIISELYFNLGMGYGNKGDIIQSTEYFLKCLQYSGKDNYDLKGYTYIMLTHIYNLTGERNESIYFLKKIVDIQDKIETDSIYYSALSYVSGYHSSISLNIDSAIFYEKKVINEGFDFINKTTLQGAYFNLAANFSRINEPDSAYAYLEDGFKVENSNLSDLDEINESNRQLMFGFHVLASNFLSRSKLKDALDAATSFVNLAVNQEDTFYIYHSYVQMSDVFYKMNLMDSAYFYQKNALKMYKSVINSDKQNELKEVKLRTEFEYKRSIDSLETQKVVEQKNSMIQKQKDKEQIVFYFMFVGVLFTLFLLFLFSKLFKSKKTITIQNNKLEISLSQNESLLNEAHHRIKNNLQIISSLLDKQAEFSSSNEVKSIMRIAQNRIQSMALLHQLLNQEKSFYNLESNLYIKELVKLIDQSYSLNKTKIDFVLNIDKLNLNIDTVVPLGLIITELVSNAIIHAFPNDREGEIIISLKNVEFGLNELIVEDNGVGITSDKKNDSSLGLSLVEGLAWQLNGDVIIDQQEQNCTRIKIMFKESI